MSKYETIVVFDGNLAPDAIAKEVKKVEELLSANGTVVKAEEWGKKALAYPINKKTMGFYQLFVYEYNGNAGQFTENNFKFNENILRHLTVTHEEGVSIFAAPKAEKADAKEGEE